MEPATSDDITTLPAPRKTVPPPRRELIKAIRRAERLLREVVPKVEKVDGWLRWRILKEARLLALLLDKQGAAIACREAEAVAATPRQTPPVQRDAIIADAETLADERRAARYAKAKAAGRPMARDLDSLISDAIALAAERHAAKLAGAR